MNNCEQLEIVFDLNTLTDAVALQRVIDVMCKLGLPDKIEFGSTCIRREEFLDQVRHSGRWSFEVHSGGLAYRFGVLSVFGYSFIHVSEQECGAAKSWDVWVAPFMQSAGFLQAWVSDVDYDYWQNTQDLMLYEDAGRNYIGLPLISNGLPPPLEQRIIDISGNPGRRILRLGYIESVGGRMWLSSSFWSRVGKREPGKLATAGWSVTELLGDMTQLETNDFHDGCSVEKQIILRSALYGMRPA